MIFLYGDSHANFSFSSLPYPHSNLYSSSVTMFRVGRDKVIPNFDYRMHNSQSILCFAYGEVDCRCHVQRQINLGRNEEDVINELSHNYINAVRTCVKDRRLVIIVAVIPPTKQSDYESINGPILHEFPFIGSDEQRVRYTKKLNQTLRALCEENGFVFFDPYTHYTDASGCLRYELSDKLVHIKDNRRFLEEFTQLLWEHLPERRTQG